MIRDLFCASNMAAAVFVLPSSAAAAMAAGPARGAALLTRVVLFVALLQGAHSSPPVGEQTADRVASQGARQTSWDNAALAGAGTTKVTPTLGGWFPDHEGVLSIEWTASLTPPASGWVRRYKGGVLTEWCACPIICSRWLDTPH